MNFGFSIGYLQKDGKKAYISPDAHKLFDECTKGLLSQMPDDFSNEVRKIMKVENYEEYCWTKDDICRLNRQYLFPFICLARHKCSIYFTDAFYTLIYANQMLFLESNEALQ